MFSTTQRATAGLAAALLSVAWLAFGATSPVHADPSADQQQLLDCTNGNDVFVVVTFSDGTSDGACVKAPTSGTAALDAADVTIGRDANGMICALDNLPNPCPTVFDGSYWQYYQATGQDAIAGNWTYATAGSDDTVPKPGWVEGWCYGSQCTPQWPGAAAAEAATATDAGTSTSGQSGSHTSLIVAVGGLVVIVVVVAIVAAKRRTKGSREA